MIGRIWAHRYFLYGAVSRYRCPGAGANGSGGVKPVRKGLDGDGGVRTGTDGDGGGRTVSVPVLHWFFATFRAGTWFPGARSVCPRRRQTGTSVPPPSFFSPRPKSRKKTRLTHGVRALFGIHPAEKAHPVVFFQAEAEGTGKNTSQAGAGGGRFPGPAQELHETWPVAPELTGVCSCRLQR